MRQRLVSALRILVAANDADGLDYIHNLHHRMELVAFCKRTLRNQVPTRRICLLAPNGRLLACTTGQAQVWHKQPQEVLGEFIWTLQPASEGSRSRRILNAVCELQEPLFVRVTASDGLPIAAFCVPLVHSGEVFAVYCDLAVQELGPPPTAIVAPIRTWEVMQSDGTWEEL